VPRNFSENDNPAESRFDLLKSANLTELLERRGEWKLRSELRKRISRPKPRPWRTRSHIPFCIGHKITSRDGKEIDKQQRELEAEATAYSVCSYFGIQSPSDFYLGTYKVAPAMLLDAVETIAGTVKTILNGCQLEVHEAVGTKNEQKLVAA
jgi:hypothetical protein